ncbi:MAG: DUF805 domain-containing protein [Rhizobacter sp.]|nr:DUF805 domain-containing protein [Rhizobacter sp.]
MQNRIGAGTYLLVMSASVIAWSALTSFVCTNLSAQGLFTLATVNWWVSLFGFVLGSVFYYLSAARLRDLNLPSWSVRLLAFPLFGVIVLPVLCFLSGQRWENDYGKPRQPSGVLKILIALCLFFIAVAMSYSALLAYYEVRRELSTNAL